MNGAAPLRLAACAVIAACGSDAPERSGTVDDLAKRCGGTWAVRAPTAGEAECPFADPHALVFSIEPGQAGVALRTTGERVSVQLGGDGGACTATFRFEDRFSPDTGTVTLALRGEGTEVTGQMRRACTKAPVGVAGRRRAEPMPARDPLPDWRLRAAYARLLETCELTHDMAAAESSRLELSLSATGALVGLSRDGAAIDLRAVCEGDRAAYARDGFLGYPGQATTRTLVLQHRAPDEVGVGPLVVGLSARALPRLGLTRASTRFGGTWGLVRSGEVLLEVLDSPLDRRVDRIVTPAGEVPSKEDLGEYLELGLGIDRGKAGATLEGWIAPENDAVFRAGERVALAGTAPVTTQRVRPLSPCSFAVGDRVTRFAGRNPIYWDEGGQLIEDSLVLCESGKVFHVRAGAPTRTFEYERAGREAAAFAWRRTRERERVL